MDESKTPKSLVLSIIFLIVGIIVGSGAAYVYQDRRLKDDKNKAVNEVREELTNEINRLQSATKPNGFANSSEQDAE